MSDNVRDVFKCPKELESSDRGETFKQGWETSLQTQKGCGLYKAETLHLGSTKMASTAEALFKAGKSCQVPI